MNDKKIQFQRERLPREQMHHPPSTGYPPGYNLNVFSVFESVLYVYVCACVCVCVCVNLFKALDKI
jgi:hypothetical protein